jgi:hypothetical protein
VRIVSFLKIKMQRVLSQSKKAENIDISWSFTCMDSTTKSTLAGFLLLAAFIIGCILLSPPAASVPPGGTTSPTLTPTTLPTTPDLTRATPDLTRTVAPTSTPTLTSGQVQARIVSVDISQLGLGRTTYAYITLINTGTVPIIKERTEITAGRDFGFPLGYQSRFFVQELYDRVEPGEAVTLRQSFDLPLYEGIVPLEGLYQVVMRLYANDYYFIGEWTGEVYLKG